MLTSRVYWLDLSVGARPVGLPRGDDKECRLSLLITFAVQGISKAYIGVVYCGVSK